MNPKPYFIDYILIAKTVSGPCPKAASLTINCPFAAKRLKNWFKDEFHSCKDNVWRSLAFETSTMHEIADTVSIHTGIADHSQYFMLWSERDYTLTRLRESKANFIRAKMDALVRT